MKLFEPLADLEKVEPSKEIEELYFNLYELASMLKQILSELVKIQKEVVEKNISFSKYDKTRPTGALRLEKSRLIEEENPLLKQYDLITRLEVLEKFGSSKFEKLSKDIENSGPLNPEEQLWLMNIKKVLMEIKNFLPNLEDITQIRFFTNQKQLDAVNAFFKKVEEILKEYHENVELKKEELKREVLEHEISPLLRHIYEDSKEDKKYNGAVVYFVTREELNSLHEESEKINQCSDERFKVIWRGWWRGHQEPEIDVNTPLKEPHVNVTMKLFGRNKKDIHLLIKAA